MTSNTPERSVADELRERAKVHLTAWDNHVFSDADAELDNKAADALDAKDRRIAELEADGFKLSAGVCEFRGGNEHGNPMCLATGMLIDAMRPVASTDPELLAHEEISSLRAQLSAAAFDFLEAVASLLARTHGIDAAHRLQANFARYTGGIDWAGATSAINGIGGACAVEPTTVCSTYHSRAIGAACSNCGHSKEAHDSSACAAAKGEG